MKKFFYQVIYLNVLMVAAITFAAMNAGASTFTDDFSSDSRLDYTVTNTWTKGGVGQFLYDSAGQRLQVVTGDDVSLRFEKALPTVSNTGVSELDFLPTQKYPNGGEITVYLMQDADNYYKIDNTDGYGPGTVSKVVGGQVVDSAPFSAAYGQNINYHLRVIFTPETVRFEAFGQVITLAANSVGILVGTLRVELAQQSGYFDNLSFSSELPNLAPTAEAGANQTVIEGQSVTLDGSGSVDPDGTIVSYLWAQTSGTAVSFAASAVQPTFTAPSVSGASQTLSFALTVTDNSGATASDTVTVTVQPQGGASAFTDDFSTDTRLNYTVTNTWTKGGVGQFLYDSTGKRLRVVTGDDVSLRFEKALPTVSNTGVLELDFLPTQKYPNGGEITVYLMQDANNYYKIDNTDGYGPGTVSKVVNGQVVDSAPFASAYSQNQNYHLRTLFTPETVRFEAFGQVATLSANSTGLLVGTFRAELSQQTGYFDNLSFSSELPNLAPTAEAGANQTVIEGQSVTLDGSGSVDPDGTIVSYLWAQTSGTAVSFAASAVQPTFTAPSVSGASQTLSFALTVTDNSGATASDTVTVTVQPQGGASAFTDDFSTDTRLNYTVTNTWTKGGVGQFLYDSTGKRLRVVTGDDVSLRFEKALPTVSNTGVLELDFLPTQKYPNGGEITVYLMQDANNYYKIDNTDGYGPGTVSKVMNGQVVDSAPFASAYSQNINYHLRVIYTPETVRFEAFGQVVTLSANSTGLLVGTFRAELSQQTGYFDNLSFSSELPNLAPTAEAGANQTVIEGQSVTLDGSGSVDPDGTIVSYLWAQTSGTAVSFAASAVQPTFTAPSVSSASQTLSFALTVTDNSGATASDTVTVTVLPQGGGASTFTDDFSTDTRLNYTVTNTWTKGGVGQFLYDSTGKRLRVVTGDDVSLRFEKALPTVSSSGVLELDFLPTQKYPLGGEITVYLMQDANNYYKIDNTDGYGPGTVSKVVNGQVVNSAPFASAYSQNINYHLRVIYTPETVRFEAFGQAITLSANNTGLQVGTFRAELSQQTGYFDNINFSSEIPNLAPTANAGANQMVIEGQSVTLDGSGSVDPDGTIVSYLWKQTSGTAVSFASSAVQPSFTAPQVSGASQTLGFTLTVTDNSGMTASDTVTVTVQPQGGTSAFTDDFSSDSRLDYTVTNTWTKGGVGQFLYDSTGKRLQVITGDDVSLRFEKALPKVSSSGVLELDFLPTKKYPLGGEITVSLMQDANNYYKIDNTDGYGPGTVSKVVAGQVVDSAPFSTGYSQNQNYHLRTLFTPETVSFEVFGQVITLTGNSAGLMVGTIRVELSQQSGYFDNLSFSSDVSAANLNPIARFQSQLQSGAGPFSVYFDASSSTDPDGSIVQYLWDFGDGKGGGGKTVTHTYSAGGTYPVTLTVIDDGGSSGFKMMNVANNTDRYVAIGDSITRGSHDDITADGIGYEPILAGLLKNETGYVNVVANEGVSGNTSADGLNALPTVLANNQAARYILILYGTNDAFLPVPSGLGLMPKDPGYAGTFKDNMQRIITAVVAAGKIPYLAKIPFATGSFANLDPLIEKYNNVVDELAIYNGIDVVPPNLYCLYQTYPDQLSDGLHPTGVGYQSLAHYWLNALTGQNSGECF